MDTGALSGENGGGVRYQPLRLELGTRSEADCGPGEAVSKINGEESS